MPESGSCIQCARPRPGAWAAREKLLEGAARLCENPVGFVEPHRPDPLRSMRRPASVPFLAAASLLLALALGASARADEVSDGVDAARILDRAGRTDDALARLEALLEEHPGDVRVQYHRARLLRKLDREREAGDAIEAALAAIERGGDPAAAEDVASAVRELADDLLKYRRKALDRAVEFLRAKQPLWGLYVADDLERLGLDEDKVKALRARAGSRARAAYAEMMRPRRLAPSGSGEASGDAERDEKLLAENIEAAEKALGRRQWDEARLSARAALMIDPDSVDALLIVSEALGRSGKRTSALGACLRAVDLPKSDPRAARAWQRKAAYLLGKMAPGLEEYVEDRSKVARYLVSQHRIAERRKREGDVAWIEEQLARLAPGDHEVTEVLEGRVPAAPLAGRGARDLAARPADWEWNHKGSGTGHRGRELVLTSNGSEYMTQALCSSRTLPDRFVLRFEMRYDLERGQDHAFFLTFNEKGANDAGPFALIFVPEGRHHVGFARMRETGWRITEVHDFPEGKPAPREWSAYEVRWDAESRRLRLSVDDLTTFDYRLGEEDRIGGVWGFGFGAGESLRLRKIFLLGSE